MFQDFGINSRGRSPSERWGGSVRDYRQFNPPERPRAVHRLSSEERQACELILGIQGATATRVRYHGKPDELDELEHLVDRDLAGRDDRGFYLTSQGLAAISATQKIHWSAVG